MNFYNKLFGSTLILAGIVMAMPVHASERALTAEELHTMIRDIDVAFSGKGISGVTSYRTNGNVRTELSIGFSDEGKWWFDDNRICVRWERLKGGRASCFVIYEGANNTYRTSHGYTIRAL